MVLVLVPKSFVRALVLLYRSSAVSCGTAQSAALAVQYLAVYLAVPSCTPKVVKCA